MNIVFVIVAVIGGILWSLYIIDPPGNHALSEEEARQARIEEEQTDYYPPILSTEVGLDTMNDLAKKGPNISQEERDKIIRQVEEMQKDLQTIKDTVQYDK